MHAGLSAWPRGTEGDPAEKVSTSSKDIRTQRTSCDHCLGSFVNTTETSQRLSDTMTWGERKVLHEMELLNWQVDMKAMRA